MQTPPNASPKRRSRSGDAALPFSRARRRASDPMLRRLVRDLLAARVRAGLTQEEAGSQAGHEEERDLAT